VDHITSKKLDRADKSPENELLDAEIVAALSDAMPKRAKLLVLSQRNIRATAAYSGNNVSIVVEHSPRRRLEDAIETCVPGSPRGMMFAGWCR
jgi:hypothetical protein